MFDILKMFGILNELSDNTLFAFAKYGEQVQYFFLCGFLFKCGGVKDIKRSRITCN